LVFKELKKTKTGESVKLIDDGKKIWEITKGYGSDSFEDNSSSIGYRIDVFQESINQTISEYLVNFDYLNRVMSAYGFELVNHAEAADLGLPASSGLFSDLFLQMSDEIEKNKFKAKDYERAPFMTTYEKKISFLNRYFVYKKVRTVNLETVQLELGEYQENVVLENAAETAHAQEVAVKEVKKIAPRVRKLSQKMLLVASSEAAEDMPAPQTKAATKAKKTATAKSSKTAPAAKKLLILESDDEDN
jgi:head-tail adaptor